MKVFFTLILSLLIAVGLQAQRNCGTTHYNENLMRKDPSLRQKMMVSESVVKNWARKHPATKNGVITIPVVVHVLYNSSVQNISDAQIQTQIDVLNADYRRLNADTANTPLEFDSISADIEIEFCLAHQSPTGAWTNGITRTYVTKTSYDLNDDDAKFSSKGGVDAWNTKLYLNIWVVPKIMDGAQSGILGYAQFPGGASATDGVVIGYRYFGTIGTVTYPYNKGRTTTHELGHWFGLLHIWGDDYGSCSGSDMVQDTPNQADYNMGCPAYPHPSCSNHSDMFMNYMDYTDDRCMNAFTEGQKTRMMYYLDNYRSALKTSTKCQIVSMEEHMLASQLKIYPNPASDMLNIDFGSDVDESLQIKIFNAMGQEVYHMEADYFGSNLLVNTSSFTNGIYYLQIQGKDFSINRKIEIIR